MSELDTERVSAHTDSARVVAERPPGPHIGVVSWPAEECPDAFDGAALDVYVRKSKNEQDHWPIYEEYGAFTDATAAVEAALGFADELGIPVLDEIRRIE